MDGVTPLPSSGGLDGLSSEPVGNLLLVNAHSLCVGEQGITHVHLRLLLLSAGILNLTPARCILVNL